MKTETELESDKSSSVFNFWMAILSIVGIAVVLMIFIMPRKSWEDVHDRLDAIIETIIHEDSVPKETFAFDKNDYEKKISLIRKYQMEIHTEKMEKESSP